VKEVKGGRLRNAHRNEGEGTTRTEGRNTGSTIKELRKEGKKGEGWR
jgi:hypothetical protein